MFLPSIDPLPLIVGHQLSVRKVFSCLYMRSIEEGREFNGEMRLDTNAETAERALMMRVLSATRSADKSRSLLHHSPQHVETSSRSHHVQTPTRHRSDSHFLHAPKSFFSNTVWFQPLVDYARNATGNGTLITTTTFRAFSSPYSDLFYPT